MYSRNLCSGCILEFSNWIAQHRDQLYRVYRPCHFWPLQLVIVLLVKVSFFSLAYRQLMKSTTRIFVYILFFNCPRHYGVFPLSPYRGVGKLRHKMMFVLCRVFHYSFGLKSADFTCICEIYQHNLSKRGLTVTSHGEANMPQITLFQGRLENDDSNRKTEKWYFSLSTRHISVLKLRSFNISCFVKLCWIWEVIKYPWTSLK